MIEWVISTSLLIVIVMVLRRLLKDRIRPWVRYALWLVVLARLLVPFQFGEFDFSMMNGVEQLPVVQEIDSMRNVDQIAHMDDGSVEGYDLSGLSADTPQIVARNKTEQEFQKMETSLKLRNLFVAVWKAGMLLMAAVFLAGNGKFRAKLIRSRRLLSMENTACPVYVTESIETPCLFGFFKPAIYVTPEVAADSRTLRYAVEHEMSHYRQKDPLWSLLRGICLILQWFNPLVWAAAVLSKNDCELACDAATIRRLGEEERADYGRTLIEMTRPGRNVLLINATTMTGSRHALKERIEMIAKKPKMAVCTLIVVILVAAAAVLVTFTGAKNDGFYQWLQSVETENVSDAVMTVYHEDGQSRQHLSKQNTVDDLIQILHTIEKNDLKEVDIDGNTGEAQLYLGMYFEESELPQPQDCIFKLTSDGKIQMLFDKNTAESYCRTGKTWQIDEPQLTEYFTVMMAGVEYGSAETDLMSFMKTVKAADFDKDYLIGNVSFEELVEVLNQVTEGEIISIPEQPETQYWRIDAFLKASPEEEDSDEEPRRQISLSCGLEENLVEIEYYSGAGASERMVFHDEALYNLVRHARDYEEIVDSEAYEKFADVLVPQMEFHMNSMSEANPGIYDYELTRFCRIGAYEEEDGNRVELYDFDYALLTDDVESIMWAGGMCLDSQCHIHGFNGGGQFAVRYRGGKVTSTAFMGNDFGVSSADFENKEAQGWIKERLKNALDQAE